jgi:hypothetical protein
MLLFFLNIYVFLGYILIPILPYLPEYVMRYFSKFII